MGVDANAQVRVVKAGLIRPSFALAAGANGPGNRVDALVKPAHEDL